MIDTTKLMEAHAKVVDLAHREAFARDELQALRANAEQAQRDIDAIAAQMLAVASPAEHAGITAVVAAIDPVAALDTPVDALAPAPATSIEAALAAMAANAPQ